MTNFNGQYKDEWKKRTTFFEKQTGIAEKRVIKTEWAPKVYNPFNKKKKAEDSRMEKLFASLDQKYAAMIHAAPADFKAAAAVFQKEIKAVERAAATAVMQVMNTLDAKDHAKQMSAADKKQHVLDVKNLSKLFESDIYAITQTAQAALVSTVKSHKDDGTTDMTSAMTALKDIKVRKTAMQSNITKGLAWLNKLDRQPTVDHFNKGVEQACRDVCAQIVACKGVFDAPKDKQILAAVDKVLSPFGNASKKLTDKDGFEAVMATSVRLRKSMQALGTWTKSIKA